MLVKNDSSPVVINKLINKSTKPATRTLLHKIFNTDTKKTKKNRQSLETSYEFKLMAITNGILYDDEREDEKYDCDKTRWSSPTTLYDGIASNSKCIDGNITVKGDKLQYYIGSLGFVHGSSVCRKIPGQVLILLFEKYLKSRKDHVIHGALHDGASTNNQALCNKLKAISTSGQITREMFLELKAELSSVSLSILTVCKTGLKYYEKFGYMTVAGELKGTESYADCFNKFLDVLISRLNKLLDSVDNIKCNCKNEALQKKRTLKIKKSLDNLKALLGQVRPDVTFKLDRLVDLYKLIDVDKYSIDFFVKDGKQEYTTNMLLYIGIFNSVVNLLRYIKDIDDDGDSTTTKFLRVDKTDANAFILEQHSKLLTIKCDYLGEMNNITATKNSILSSSKKLEIMEKVTKVMSLQYELLK